jgi:hypothetical protein
MNNETVIAGESLENVRDFGDKKYFPRSRDKILHANFGLNRKPGRKRLANRGLSRHRFRSLVRG